MALHWTPAMSTGSARLDAQHQELIARLNELSDAYLDGHGAARLPDMLEYLGHYAIEHFLDEESAMETHHCPMAETNRKQHAYFLSRLGEIQKAAAVRGPSSVILLQTIQELSGWLITHIQGCDAKLRGCIVKTPDSRAAVPR